ncbi:MAG: hypothetical protein IJR27_05435 [Synergistaceae bacterium]|nr:hypothetical protein [Synergistaceae bacterium]
MATSTFDRPLVLEKEEDIKRFWVVMRTSKPKPIYIDRNFMREMDECAELFLQKVKNARSH